MAKVQILENLGIIGLLRHSVDLRQGVGYPRCDEAKLPKWHSSGTSRCSIATPQCNYCLQRAIFGLLFRKSSFCTPIVYEP